MQGKVMKEPGPDHPITLEPVSGRVVVKRGGTNLADSNAALTMQECDYPPVLYIPRADVDMSLLRRSDHATY